jgi:hypothetical protein
MLHPDLYNTFNQLLIQGYDDNKLYCRIDENKGLVIDHITHGGNEDALPRHLVIIANALQSYIEETENAKWDIKDGVEGILWLDENQWQPLSDIGVNKEYGFYSLEQFPDVINDAELLDGES